MSAEIEAIRQIFNDAFINDSSEFIEEAQEGMKRIIHKGSIDDEDIAIYRLDQNGKRIDMFPYLKKSRDSKLVGMKRICDFVIFVSDSSNLYVLLIEMKKGKESPQEQLDVTVPLIHFVFNRAKTLGYWQTGYIIRKIGISDCSGKRDTMNRGEIIYDDNDYVKLYEGKRIYLERFLH